MTECIVKDCKELATVIKEFYKSQKSWPLCNSHALQYEFEINVKAITKIERSLKN